MGRKLHGFLIVAMAFATLSAAAQCQPQSALWGSPCAANGINPFCTDENPYGVTFPSGLIGEADVFFGGENQIGCLWSSPCPAWYYMRISTPGNLLIYIEQEDAFGNGLDVDFACWGPFTANSASQFVENLCCGYYNLATPTSVRNHRPDNGDHTNDMGDYPAQNMIDCSYHVASTEWCYIPNAQVGQFYILLITNFDEEPGTINFNAVNAGQTISTATTDCSLLAQVSCNAPVCEGDTLRLFCMNPEAGATYSWTGPNGWTSHVQDPVIPNATAAISGTYTLIKSLNGAMSDPVSLTITVNPMPTVTLTASQTSICSDEDAILTATGGGTYQWSTGASSAQITVHPQQQMEYSVSVTSDSGCVVTRSITITASSVDSVLLEDEICLGERYNANGFNLMEQTEVGDTILERRFTNMGGCDSLVRLTLHRYALPVIEVVSLEEEHCGQRDGSIIVSVTGGEAPLDYLWNPQNEGDTLLNLRGGTYTLDVTDARGCRSSRSIYLPGSESPVACFTLSPSLNNFPLGTSITFLNCSQHYTNWNWDLGNGYSPTDFSPVYTYPEIGVYTATLIVQDDNGCSDTLQKEVDVREVMRLYVPNSFSPNGDGLNDVFKPIGIEISEVGYTMSVYNRWGELVFMTHNLNEGWDGRVNGRIVEGGSVYNYIIQYQNQEGRPFVRKGIIHVL